jgi:hypothetical protein
MKRTTTVDDLKKRNKSKDDPDVKQAYKVYNNSSDLKKDLVNADNTWDVYSAPNYTQDQKDQLEFYLCGWLQYYDQISRSYGIDHSIHFEWSDTQVVVYISPAPGRTPLSPLTGPPSTTSDPKSPTAPPPPYP